MVNIFAMQFYLRFFSVNLPENKIAFRMLSGLYIRFAQSWPELTRAIRSLLPYWIPSPFLVSPVVNLRCVPAQRLRSGWVGLGSMTHSDIPFSCHLAILAC